MMRLGGLPDPKYHVPGDPNRHFNAAGLEFMASRMEPAVEKLIGRAGRISRARSPLVEIVIDLGNNTLDLALPAAKDYRLLKEF